MSGPGREDGQAARGRAALGAAGEYLLACLADDERRIDEAVSRVDAFALNEALLTIALRAVPALAGERGVTPDEVVAALIAELP